MRDYTMKLQQIYENDFDEIHELDKDRAKIKQVIKSLSDMYHQEIKVDKKHIDLLKQDEDLLRVLETGRVFLQRLEKFMAKKTRKKIHQKSLERDLTLPPDEDGIMSDDEYYNEGKIQDDDVDEIFYQPSNDYKKFKHMSKSKNGKLKLKKILNPLDYYLLGLW